MPLSSDAYFHVVRFPSTIDPIARQLYGDANSVMAKEFKFVNQLALIEGVGVIPGQMLYLPEPVCYHPDLQDEIIRFVGSINEKIIFQMDNEQRRIIAENSTFASNAAESSNILVNGLSMGNGAASTLVAGTSTLTKSIGESLKNLERAYQQSFRVHGRLTPDFYTRRTQIYQQLDSKLGRLGRTVAFGTPFDKRSTTALKVHTKSQVLHWKRSGGGPVSDFQGHFDRFAKTTRYLKFGGYVTIGIDVALNEYAISEACKSGDENHCSQQTCSLRGKTTGTVLGGLGGGALATYGICNAAFGVKTLGTSLLWCGLIVGGTGAASGGYLIGKGGQAIGEAIYESSQPLR